MSGLRDEHEVEDPSGEGEAMASAAETSSEPVKAPAVRLVAIGASAGGLEPIEQFFEGTQTDSGAAYVIVQHLSPDFRSMMPELLKRHSALNIRIIEDGMAIEPNTIYLNPPRSSLQVSDGKLQLQETTKVYEFSLPINEFLESLAVQYQDQAICVIMSGTGTDGTLGAEAIAAAGGSVLAQDPATAKFESMPRSIIEAIPGARYGSPTALSDMVADLIAGKKLSSPEPEPELEFAPPERRIVRLLQTRFGLDFGYYKTSTVGRRISRRAKLKGLNDLADYADVLAADTEELEELYADLLIGVTAFFRDKQAFDLLASRVIPRLGSRMLAGNEVRIWVPGCASGEEAYSLAILLAERARIVKCPINTKIFATDIHPRSLRAASRAIFSRESVASVPEDLRDRYFSMVGDQYQLNKVIREQVVFSKHNLIRDPPFTRMDLVSCRNMLIYLDDEAQRKVIAMFHFALRQGGALFLGPSETLAKLADEFDAVDNRWRIFTKRRDVRLLEATRLLPITSGFSQANRAMATAATDSVEQRRQVGSAVIPRHNLMRIYDAVLAKTVGSSLLVNRSGEVLYVFGDAGRFLRFDKGQFSQKIGDLVDDQLKLAISSGLEWARKSGDEDFMRTVAFKEGDGAAPVSVVVTVSAVDDGGDVDQTPLLITLARQSRPAAEIAEMAAQPAALDDSLMQQRLVELERDLRFAEETLQTTTEELETSNEELQATNEELQATNEELMASNEELQTVNEELHAVNEELYTVSSEHQTKIGELTTLTSDLDNLLQSTKIGVLFLDAEKNIRSITPAVSQTFNILVRDIGRPVSHVTSRFEFPDLEQAVDQVIRTGEVVERNIDVEGRDFLLRILPYRREQTIDGAVLTFVDITDIARANRSLSQFADIVSHDLKAPLRGIRTTSEWIVEDLRDSADDNIKSHVERLIEQTDRLSKMLIDLRDFSNLGRADERSEIVAVKDMLDEVQGMFDQSQLELKVESALPEIEAPQAALRLVFQNIIDNAVKHNDIAPTVVSVSATAQDRFWIFRMTDNGPGISPRHHEKVFLPFRKLKPVSQSPGSGIGLALVKKTIEDHGGTVEIESDPETKRGSTFIIAWPE